MNFAEFQFFKSFFPKRWQSGCIKVNRGVCVRVRVSRCGGMWRWGGVGTRPDRPAGRNLVPESREKVRGKNSGKKFGEKDFDKYHQWCDSFDRFSLKEWEKRPGNPGFSTILGHGATCVIDFTERSEVNWRPFRAWAAVFICLCICFLVD